MAAGSLGCPDSTAGTHIAWLRRPRRSVYDRTMRNLLLLLAALGVLSLAAAVPATPHREPAVLVAPVASAAAPTAAAVETAAPDPVDLAVESRTAYVLDAMGRWPRAVAFPAADYGGVALDVATAAATPEDGVLLAGLGYFEGARFAAYVDDGRCNDPAWRSSPEGQRAMRVGGDCDGGHAHSIFQIHPVVDRTSRFYDLCNADAVDGSRLGAARCALALAKSSLSTFGNLAGYTGEPAWDHPKADARLSFARAAVARHPYGPPRE
jgi:hypothetical protein